MDLYLISQKLKANTTVPYSNQVLHLAIILSSFEHFQHLLLLYSSHINDVDSNGNTILHVAVLYKKMNAIPILYQHDIDDTILNNMHKLAIDLCDDSVFGINLKQLILNHQNTYKLQTIQQLHNFTIQGQLADIQSLMTHKCINSLDFNQLVKGNTLLHSAVLNGRLNCLNYFLQYCDPLIRNEEGLLPIDYCHHSTHDKEMAALLKQQMAITPKLSNHNEMSGILLKYTNIANGYKQRWFILKNSHLYYKKYKQQHHYRGKIHVNQLKLVPDSSDVHKFIIFAHDIKWHLKAEHGSEAQKWVLHILQAQKVFNEVRTPSPTTQTPVPNDMDVCIMKIANSKANLYNDYHILKELIHQYHSSHDINHYNALLQLLQQYEVQMNAYHECITSKDLCYQNLLQQERVLHLDPMLVETPQYSSHDHLKNYITTDKTSEYESSDDEFYDALSVLPGSSVAGYDFKFRQHLPVDHMMLQNEVSIISILKDAIGKDLTRITLPVYWNEPLSMLERMAEEIEYSNLLEIATKTENEQHRMLFVAAYAMSGYASTVDRLGKPFNPLLGETFEFCNKYKYISEQVSHHPAISACHCEGENWVFYSEADVKSQFGGTSLSIVPKGDSHVVLTVNKTQEHYSWRKVTTTVNNLLVGKMYIDHHGEMEIVKHGSSLKVVLDFKQSGWRLKNYQQVSGELLENNIPIGKLHGKWNDKLQFNDELILWKYNKVELNKSDFNLTPFAIALNELTPELKDLICPTDCRLRPDQRAMEEGNYEFASSEKNRLEEKQRAARKQIINYKPRWFSQAICPDTGNMYWKFNGEYWNKREQQDWAGCIDLY